jgi:hypothetical protein
MLSDADRKRLSFLNHLVVEQGQDIAREEVKWLLERMQSILSRPDEFNFPEYACMINGKEHAAIALRRHIAPNWSKEVTLGPATSGMGAEVFVIEAECPVYNAFLVARPWIRILPEVSDEATQRLRLCSIGLTLDTQTLLSDSPIEETLITKDGYSLKTPMLLRSPSYYVHPAVELAQGDATADAQKPLGVFLPNKMVARLFVKTPAGFDGWSAKVVVGFTVMEYTTRALSIENEADILTPSVKGPLVNT